MSVEVQSLTRVFGAQTAVDQVTFSAREGEVLGFLGPNGAGKTTTMKMLTTYLEPTSGSASICGFSLADDPMEIRRRIGYLPENNPLYQEMYVREYLLFLAGLHRLPDPVDRVEEMIERTGLTRERHKLIRMLSKGYRQRVGLAQAMLHDPEVLILDEPTSGLDPNQLAEIRSLIQELGKEKTVIFSTHIMQEVQALCDRVVILNRGRIVADDPIERLQGRLSGETVVTVELAEAVEANAWASLAGLTRVESAGKRKWRLYAAPDTDPRAEVFRFIVQQKWTLLGMERESRSVESVFQELTQA